MISLCCLDLVGADAERAGKYAGIGKIVERMAQVDDERRRGVVLLGCVEHLLEFCGFEAHLANLLEELALLPDAVREEAEHHGGEDEDGEVSEPCEERCALFGEVAEEIAGKDERLAPDERAGQIPGQESGIGHAGLTGDGRGDGAKAGDELGEEQCDGAAAGEVALGLRDAGGCLEREAAEKFQNAVAVAAAEIVPDGVRENACAKHGGA